MATQTCPRCKGARKIDCGYCGNSQARRISCDECNGKGKLNCPTCDGTGKVELPPLKRP